mmetsp:Transcript_47653/g.102033  ORF Transcript_47653/g.102033 Transcript_47653/m.102033 type:complete len:284 (-) Transcript_47653:401-1252(-)
MVLLLLAIGVGGVPELIVVVDANKFVQENFAGRLVGVGAGRFTCHLVALAVAAGHSLDALWSLPLRDVDVDAVGVDGRVWNAFRGAASWEGVPNGGFALILTLRALPVRLVPSHVASDAQRLDLASNDEAVLMVDVLADRSSAAASIIGDERTELTFVRIPELPRVLHCDLEPLDSVDLVLAGRSHNHLVVQVPEGSCEVGSVDVFEGVAGRTLGSVHVESLGPRSGGRSILCCFLGVFFGLNSILLDLFQHFLGVARLCLRAGSVALLGVLAPEERLNFVGA